MINYYEILGVRTDATQEEIKKAYRQHALNFHPDRNQINNSAENFFKKVTEAYNVLSNPEKREEYNISLKISKNKPFKMKMY